MKFEIQKTKLEKALLDIQPFLYKKDLASITSHVLIDAKKDKIILKATDYEIGIKIVIENQVKEDGTVTVNGKKLLDIVKVLNLEEISLEIQKDNKLTVKQSNSKFKLETFDYNEFPEFPNEKKLKKIDAESNSFITAIKQITNSIDNNNPKIELNGALIDIKDKKINFVSTDTKRLSIVKLDANIDKDIKLIIPKKGIFEIQKNFLNDPKIEFLFNETFVIFKTEQVSIFSKLINANYPNYERIIPTEAKYKWELKKDEFIEAIRVINSMSIDIAISFEKNQITFKSISETGSEEAEKKIEIGNYNNEFTIDVNSKYIVDFLVSINSNEFTFEANEKDSPFVLNGNGLKTIIMPII